MNKIKDKHINQPKFLFKNFLKDRRVYALNQRYWEKELAKHLSEKQILKKNWVNQQFADGTLFYDGNPIFSLLLKKNKAVRIIQEEPESEQPEVGAWVQTTEDLQSNPINELVIALELSDLTKDLVVQLIHDWVKEEVDQTIMEGLITERLERI